MSRRRRTAFPRLLLVFVLLALVGGCGGVSVDPPSPKGLDAGERLARGQDALADFVAALNSRDEKAFADAIDPRGRQELAPVLTNADLLDAGPIEAEYVDTVPGGLTDAEVRRFGQQAWLATARLRYTLGIDSGASGHETALVIAPRGDSAAIAAIGGHQTRSPLWLTGPIDVARQGQVTVITEVGGDSQPDPGLLAFGTRAVRDVEDVLPRWRGRLTIEAPTSKQSLDRVLAAESDTYTRIAAVTTTADGSVVPGAPVHVYLNPEVFGTLKQRGAQVVVSHEATHVATNAPFTAMPIWLLEGFADYVALKNAGVPVPRAAAQVLERLRTQGLPDALPSPEDLQPTAESLGATYEEAWLACRFLAERWGERELLRFYNAVAGGAEVTSAFRRVLGVGEDEFVRLWRLDLQRLLDSTRAS